MSTELTQNLQEILTQKETYIIPENIKKDVTVFGVTGTLEEGITDNKIFGYKPYKTITLALDQSTYKDYIIETLDAGNYPDMTIIGVTNIPNESKPYATDSYYIGYIDLLPSMICVRDVKGTHGIGKYWGYNINEEVKQLYFDTEYTPYWLQMAGSLGIDVQDFLDATDMTQEELLLLQGWYDVAEAQGQEGHFTLTARANPVTFSNAKVDYCIVDDIMTIFPIVSDEVELTAHTKKYIDLTNFGNGLTAVDYTAQDREDKATFINTVFKVLASQIYIETMDDNLELPVNSVTNSDGKVILTRQMHGTIGETGALFPYNTNAKFYAVNSDVANAIGLTAGKIAQGNTILGVVGTYEGIDTSDANATAADIVTGKTAYVNGVKITGIAVLEDGCQLITDISELPVTANNGDVRIHVNDEMTEFYGIYKWENNQWNKLVLTNSVSGTEYDYSLAVTEYILGNLVTIVDISDRSPFKLSLKNLAKYLDDNLTAAQKSKVIDTDSASDEFIIIIGADEDTEQSADCGVITLTYNVGTQFEISLGNLVSGGISVIPLASIPVDPDSQEDSRTINYIISQLKECDDELYALLLDNDLSIDTSKVRVTYTWDGTDDHVFIDDKLNPFLVPIRDYIISDDDVTLAMNPSILRAYLMTNLTAEQKASKLPTYDGNSITSETPFALSIGVSPWENCVVGSSSKDIDVVRLYADASNGRLTVGFYSLSNSLIEIAMTDLFENTSVSGTITANTTYSDFINMLAECGDNIAVTYGYSTECIHILPHTLDVGYMSDGEVVHIKGTTNGDILSEYEEV